MNSNSNDDSGADLDRSAVIASSLDSPQWREKLADARARRERKLAGAEAPTAAPDTTPKTSAQPPRDTTPESAPDASAATAAAVASKRRPASFYVLLSLVFLIGIAAGALALLWISGGSSQERLTRTETGAAVVQAPVFIAPRSEVAIRYQDGSAAPQDGDRDGFLAGVASAEGLASSARAKIERPAPDSGLQTARFDRLRAVSSGFDGVRVLVQPPPDADGWEQDLRLRDAGFTHEILPAARFAPPRTVVQFFDHRDQAAAARLAEALGGDVVDLTKFKPRPADRRVEIYLAD